MTQIIMSAKYYLRKKEWPKIHLFKILTEEKKKVHITWPKINVCEILAKKKNPLHLTQIINVSKSAQASNPQTPYQFPESSPTITMTTVIPSYWGTWVAQGKQLTLCTTRSDLTLTKSCYIFTLFWMMKLHDSDKSAKELLLNWGMLTRPACG